MGYISFSDTSLGLIDLEANKLKGLELHECYMAASPFPHIAIDEFIPTEVLDGCLEDFPKELDQDGMKFDRAQERLKFSYNPDFLSSRLRSFFYSLNSRPFINFLENITGIEGLIPDPYFYGGGFHEIKQGGHLSVHADFNHHKKMNLERRINVLIYMNKGWTAENGGQIELWSDDMSRCEKSYVPLFNRCVIFNTTSQSNHGNPQQVNHPDGISRRSIALYYYTATWQNGKQARTTQFRPRQGTHDQIDWRVKASEIMQDWLPPIFHRNLSRARNRLMRPKADV